MKTVKPANVPSPGWIHASVVSIGRPFLVAAMHAAYPMFALHSLVPKFNSNAVFRPGLGVIASTPRSDWINLVERSLTMVGGDHLHKVPWCGYAVRSGFAGFGKVVHVLSPSTTIAVPATNWGDIMRRLIGLPFAYFIGLLFSMATSAQTISTIAGDGTRGFGGDGGPAKAAMLNLPIAVAVNKNGLVFVSDVGNNRIRVIAPDGTISTYAGNGSSGFGGDNGPATEATLNGPYGLTVDRVGNLIFADLWNHRIRMISPDGIISTIVGNGSDAFSGDGGLAINAGLRQPWGVAKDEIGNLYVSDIIDNRIRKIDTAGLISTFAGNGSVGFGGDGGAATSAMFHEPAGLSVDGAGNLYVADNVNCRIRRVDSSGIITTSAGTGLCRFGGDGGSAKVADLNYPVSVAIDWDGSQLIVDSNNHRIRRIDPNDLISTVAGNGVKGFNGDDGLAIETSLNTPIGVAVDFYGRILIADQENNRVRRAFSHVRWPLRSVGVDAISQDYSTFNDPQVDIRKYHTGFDVSRTSPNESVYPVARGEVTLIQLNGGKVFRGLECKYRKDLPSNCADHGDGNTVILKHDNLSGVTLYSQYQHLASISDDLKTKCGTPDPLTLRTICSPGVFVNTTEFLGVVGGTGFGLPDKWPTHLHFEIKTIGTLETNVNGKPEFGYTSLDPSSIGFVDPVILLGAVKPLNAGATVKPLPGYTLHVGPGELDRAEYTAIGSSDVYLDRTLYPVRESLGTSLCPGGWYQIQLVPSIDQVDCGNQPRNCFARQGARRPSYPESWICKAGVTPVLNARRAR
jgi:murein DD-endopeptidase MepM/ murein hydrolase activator NlpD